MGDVGIKENKLPSSSLPSPSAWLRSCSLFSSGFKGPAAHSISACHIYTFPVYGYPPKSCFCLNSVTYLLKFKHCGALESLRGRYLCHQTEQLTSKGQKGEMWKGGNWARLSKIEKRRTRRIPSGWWKALTGKEFTVYEGCHGWGIKCVFALMHAVSPRLAEAVK